MLSLRTIKPHTLELLKKISNLPEMRKTRLVGGTALALQLGHRTSVDLDFFGEFDLNINFADVFSNIGTVENSTTSKIIRSLRLDGVKVDIVHYSMYPWLDQPVIEDGIVMASPKDIAAMKMQAIDGRGKRKDFIDTYFLLQHMSLEEILQLYELKYPHGSRMRVLMGLTYFLDAEDDLMPHMFQNIDWEDIKEFIRAKVQDLARGGGGDPGA